MRSINEREGYWERIAREQFEGMPADAQEQWAELRQKTR